MKVSAIIVSYKVPYHLLLCLGSLKKALTPLDSEIIVVDNASNDQTSSLVSKHFPQVKYIQNQTNDGFSGANNIGIKEAQGEYICLINPDTVISENCISSAIKKHESLDKAGILGVRLIDGTGNFLPESKINKLTLRVAAFKMLGFSSSYYNNNLHSADEGKTSTLVGAFMCFRKQDYQKVDGLDERYFMYGEDIDLSYQFSKAGFNNYYLGKESILHFKGESTLRDEVYFKRFFGSVELFFKKHYTNSKFILSVISFFFIIAKWFKKSDMEKRNRLTSSFESIYLIGEDSEFLPLLKSSFNKPVKTLEFNTAENFNFHDSLIVFNPESLSYQQIIKLMLKYRNSDNIFRIKLVNQNVLIGSDSSTSQGKVVFLKCDKCVNLEQ